MDKYLKNTVIERLKMEEGFSQKPYKCTSGKLTIGYGRNLEDVGITQDEAQLLLENDFTMCYGGLARRFYLFRDLPTHVQQVLLDMAFNMGINSTMGFKRMLRQLELGNYERAAEELGNSLYAKQVPNRFRRNFNLLKGL